MTKRIGTILILSCLALGGCLSAFHRVDEDTYEGGSATFTGNGRTTTMATSQPTAPTPEPAPAPVVQVAPEIGELFLVRVHGRVYEAMKKTDGRIYIIREIK